MLGAIIGDMIGSVYENNNIKTKEFPLFNMKNRMTDDSLLTIEVARVLMKHLPLQYDELSIKAIQNDLITNFTRVCRNNMYAGWGSSFFDWCKTPTEYKKPYNSFGNGAAMRISPVGWIAKSKNEVKVLSKIVTEITHNHPEGLKGAESVAMCIYLALHGYSKKQIKDYVIHHYYPEITTLDYQRLVQYYSLDVSCQQSVPHAIYCFLISLSFEDAIRTAISIGGDSDTIGAMTGSIAEAFYQKDQLSPLESEFIYLAIDPGIDDLIYEFHSKINSHKFKK